MKHLNEIARRWRDAKKQERTLVAGARQVSMNLAHADRGTVTVTFPDVPGEAYRQIWEERRCDEKVAETLRGDGVALFIHSDTIKPPRWVTDTVAQMRHLGLEIPEGQEVAWHPRLSPTQVQIVAFLQTMREAPLSMSARKLAIMLSAWDKSEAEHLAPADFLAAKCPLLDQYLRRSVDGWDVRVYGVSAQGGEYDDTNPDAPPILEAQRLRELARASDRIKLVRGSKSDQDLTEPLAWVLELATQPH